MRYEDASGAFQASGPIANDDADTLAAGSRGPATGNLITGEGTQYGDAGADTAAGAKVAAIAGQGGEDANFSSGKLSVAGAYGQLTVDAEGNYSYLANKGSPENVRDRFTYTLADNEGNTDTAALIVEIGKTPAVIKADAQQIVPGPDGVVTLPPGVELSDIMVVGRNLVINMPDGTQLIIVDGAVFVPQLVLGGVEVPATNVAALLIGQEPQPAAGETPLSSGGNFALPPPPLDPGVPLGDLLPPTEYDYTPPEPEETFLPLDEEPEILIQPVDQAPSVSAVDQVDEAGLPTRNGGEPEGSGEGADGNPSNDSHTGEATSGTILIDSPDGVDSVSINGVVVTGVVGQQIEGEYGTLTITGFSGDNILYSYVLNDNTSGDDTHDDFLVVLTDTDGDEASATLTIDIIDDVPTARNDTDAVVKGETSTDGNVMTSVGTTNGPAGKDTVGADNAEVTGVHAGTSGTFTNVPDGGVTIAGQFGDLTLFPDGSYTYELTDENGAGGNDVFTYQLTDGDGDISTATLTITVPADLKPNLPDPAVVQLDDDDVGANGNPGGPGDDAPSGLPGQLNGSGGDGPLTYNFTGLDTLPTGFTAVPVDASTVEIYQGATLVMTVTLNNATGAFNIVQESPINHPSLDGMAGDNTENNLVFEIGVEVEDGDGDTEPATITINVDDDTPVADAEGSVTGLVDEDDLPAGNNDSADGDADPGNADGDADGTTTAGGAGSLFALFDFGADQPGTISLSSDTSELPVLTSNGLPVTYAVVGNVLTASAGGSTVFTLTVNADGSWKFDLEGQLDHPVAGTEDDLVLDFSSVILGEDADGDEITAADGAFEITVDDDLPVPGRDVNTVIGQVDEDSLPDGNNDMALGDDPGGVTASGGVGSLLALFNIGADQPGSIVLLSDTSELPALTSAGVPVTYSVVGNVLTGSAGGNPVFTLTVNADGSWEFELQGQLDHSIAGTEDNLLIDFSSVIGAVDADGDPASAPDGSFIIDVDDDMPQEFEDCPEDVITVNEPGSTFTGDLNLPPVGADDPGVVTFNVTDGDPVLDTGGQQLTSGGELLFYFINDDGVLEARVGDETGDVIFTITINGDGTFTYEQVGPIGEGGETVFDDLTSSAAGNVDYRGVGEGDAASEIDLILSGSDAGGADVGVNTDSDSIGADNQSMDVGETVRIDFVTNLQSSAVNAGSPMGFTYDDHVDTNSYIQTIPQVQANQDSEVAFRVWALDSNDTQANEPDRDPNGGFNNSASVVITSVTVIGFDVGESDPLTLDITGVAVGVWTDVGYGISVQKQADGSVIFTGVQEGDQYGVGTGANSFNAVAVQSQPSGTGPVGNQSDQDSFDLGVFAIGTVQDDEPLDLSIPISYTDSDGDPVVCDIDIHIGPALDAPNVAVTVDEAGLPLIGSDSASDSETQSGDLQGVVTGGTGPYTFSLVGSGDGTYGTLVLNPDGTYTYTLDTPFDSLPDADDGTNPELGAESFTFEVTDQNGITKTGTITVNIIDDVPTANDDVADQANEGVPITVDVMANDIEGADGVDEDNNPDVRVELVDGTLSGSGNLVYNDDGTFTYTPANGEEGVVTFDYQITDNDGDVSIATVTLNLADDSEPRIAQPQNVIVDEDGLAGANVDAAPLQSDPAETDSTESATGTGQVVVHFGDDVPGAPLLDSIELLDSAALDGQLVDLDGNPVTFALNGAGQLVGTANSTTVMIISVTAAVAGPGAGEVTYTYQAQLLQPVQHVDDGNNENSELLSGVQFQVIDSDGDPATGSFDVTVIDDVPSASDEPQQDVAEGNQTVSGSFDFVEGADGASVTHINGTALVFGGDQWSQWIAVDDGQIRAQADGSYEFQSDAAGSGVTSGTFTVTDGDGDEVVADWAFNVTDANAPTGGVSSARLDDDGLANGNPASTTGDIDANVGEIPVVNSEEDIFHGQLTLSFGGDGPGTVSFAAMHGTMGAVGAETVLYSWAGNTLTATVEGGPRDGTPLFEIVVNPTTGEYTLTLLDNVIHAAGGDETSAPNVALTYTVTDSDNSPAGGVEGTLNITFNDDAPTLSNVQAGSGVNVDETDAFPGGFPISDTSVGAVINATQAFGADGAAAANSVVYGLAIVGGTPEPSGLVTAVGNLPITLVQIDADTIQGQYNGGANIAFTIQMNADGTVTLTQNVALEHDVDGPPGPDHNDTLDLDGLINATITITDGDGDTATASAPIGDNLVFFDDGPRASTVQLTGTVDEDGVVEGADDGGEGDGIAGGPAAAGSFADVAGEATVANGNVSTLFQSGADAPLTYGLSADTSGLPALTSGGVPVTYAVVGNTLTASAGGETVFTFVVNADGSYTFTLVDQIDHPTLDNLPGDNTENDLGIPLGSIIQATDADGDTVTASPNGLVITVDDDTPVAVDDTPTLHVQFDPLGVDDMVGQWGGTVMQDGASPTAIDQDGDGAPDEIRWGTPVNPADPQSGYGYVDNASLVSQTVLTNQPFTIGTFTHYNNSINGSELLQTTLTVNFTVTINGIDYPVGPIQIQFNHEETSNNGTPEQNRDIIDIVPQTVVVNVDGVAYELKVLGLINEMGDVVTEVRTFEGQANSYQLVVQFVNTEQFDLTGNVLANDSSGADEAIEVVSATGFNGSADSSADGSGNFLVNGQYGTLTINEDGSYTYTLTANAADVPDGYVEHFTYTIADADGDGTTADLDITLDIDQAPSVTNAVASSDDDGLPNGNTAAGTGDLNANLGEAGGGNPSEAIFVGQFVASGGDGALTYSLANMDGLSGTVGTESVTYSWNAGMNVLTATVSAGARVGTELFTVQVNPATGQYTLTQLDNVLHAPGNNENDATTVISFGVEDSDGDVVFGNLTITFDDDVPVAIQPDPATIANEAGASVTEDLDDDGEVISDFGADGPGLVQFANISNGDQSGMLSGGDIIEYWVSNNGQTLQGRTNSTNGIDGELIFTVQINQATGDYTVTMTGTIDNGGGFVLSDFGEAPAGQNDWIGVDSDGGDINDENNDSPDILLTPTNVGGSVNTDDDDIGNGNQWIASGEGIRVDYVTDVRRDGANDEKDLQGYTFDGHFVANGSSFSVMQTQGNGSGASVRITALSDVDTGNIKTLGGSIVPIDASSIVVTGDASYTIINMGDGTFVITGLAAGANVAFDTNGVDYNAISITSAAGLDNPNIAGTNLFGGDDFSIGEFGFFTEASGDPIDRSFDLTITDADGDTVSMPGAIDITFEPAAQPFMATMMMSQEEQLQKTAANSNTLTLAAAVGAAGMAEAAAAAPTDQARTADLSDVSLDSYSNQVVEKLSVESSDDGGQLMAATSELAASNSGLGNPSDHGRGATHGNDNKLDAGSGHSSQEDSSSGQPAADQGPASAASAPAPVAPTVAMVSAEALQAAGLNGEAKHGGSVEQIVADALGQGDAPTVDGLLANLPGGLGGVAELAQVASQGAGNVPGWDMASHAPVGAGFDMMFKVDVAMHHQDAIQPVVNG